MLRKIATFALLALLTGCAAQPVQTQPTTVTTLPVTSVPTTETTAPATTAPVTAPKAFCEVLEANGMTLQTLTQLGCNQLVTVGAEGTAAQIALYCLEDGSWQEILQCTGYVGKNGTAEQKQEGDKCTPKGLFPVLEAFYIGLPPQTLLPSFQITKDTYWVDDPASAYYNQRAEGTQNKDWRSAEHMSAYPDSYEYGFVIGYNTEAVPGAGSAIFFHVGSRPTAGCIAADRSAVLSILAALDQAQTPYIIIY